MKKYLEDRGIYITYSQLAVRIIFDLVGFLLALLPAGLTLYLTRCLDYLRHSYANLVDFGNHCLCFFNSFLPVLFRQL